MTGMTRMLIPLTVVWVTCLPALAAGPDGQNGNPAAPPKWYSDDSGFGKLLNEQLKEVEDARAVNLWNLRLGQISSIVLGVLGSMFGLFAAAQGQSDTPPAKGYRTLFITIGAVFSLFSGLCTTIISQTNVERLYAQRTGEVARLRILKAECLLGQITEQAATSAYAAISDVKSGEK